MPPRPEPGAAVYSRVYHEENGEKLDAIRGELSYSPVDGIAIEIKELAWL